MRRGRGIDGLTLPLCSVAGGFFCFGCVNGVSWVGADTGPVCGLAAAFLGGEGEGWLLCSNTTVSHFFLLLLLFFLPRLEDGGDGYWGMC